MANIPVMGAWALVPFLVGMALTQELTDGTQHENEPGFSFLSENNKEYLCKNPYSKDILGNMFFQIFDECKFSIETCDEGKLVKDETGLQDVYNQTHLRAVYIKTKSNHYIRRYT